MAIDTNTQLTLLLTLERVNIILGALGNSALPFNQINPVITDIQQQAVSQLQQIEARTQVDSDESIREAQLSLFKESPEEV